MANTKLKDTAAKLGAMVQKHPWQSASMGCAVLALWFALGGVGIYGQNKAERDILQTRDQAVKALTPTSNTLISQMLAGQKKLEPLTESTNADAIKLAFTESVKGAERVDVYPLELTEAYANIGNFGVGKLAVLEASANDKHVAMRIINVAGERKLAMGKAIGAGSHTYLVYVQLPTDSLEALLNQNIPSDTYMALRQGQIDLIKRGDESLSSIAEANASTVGQTPWRVAVSAPLADKGLFEARGVAELALALLFLLAAAACWFAPSYLKKRRLAGVSTQDDGAELTLNQMHEQGIIESQKTEQKPVFNIKEAAYPKVPLERSIFRAYDIRGVVGTNLDAGIARLIGEVIGSILVEKGLKGIVVGYDGRLSSPILATGLSEGLVSSGITVINLGQVPTPVVYFAANNTEYTSAISVTGSHNPPDYNGLKIVIDGHTLSGDAITNIYERIVDKKIIKSQQPGRIKPQDILPDYTRYIANDIQIDRPLKVVVDCGNGVPGAVAPALLKAIGAEVEAIYCEVDGNFPNHHPDPSDPDNLIDLIEMVRRTNADLGLAFDGDGDRLGVVTAKGDIIYPDQILMIFAEDVLHRNPGAAIIYDVKCTGALQGHILRHGGSPIMWKTGHSLIKAKMKETHAELAGEMSGHFFFAERWFGFDDGMYAAARLLEILAAAPDGIQAKFDELPKSETTPELKIELSEGEQHAFMERFVEQAHFIGARINLIDGIRADWPYGWGLVRASNTTPVLVLRFEADTAEHMHEIQQLFREQLLALQPDLAMPF